MGAPRWIGILGLGLAVVGCSDVPQAGTQTKSYRTPTDEADKGANAQGEQPRDVPEDPAGKLTKTGIPDFCKVSEKEPLCFTCKPRGFPLRTCSETYSGDLKTNKACTHRNGTLTCELPNSHVLEFNYSEPSQQEQVYNSFETILAGAKAYAVREFGRGDPKLETLLGETIDLLGKHKDTIFFGDDFTKVIDDVAKVVQNYNPDVSEEALDHLKTKLNETFQKMLKKRQDGKFGDPEIVGLVGALLSELPDSVVNADGISIEAILGILGGGDDSSVDPEKILGGLSGEDDGSSGEDDGSSDGSDSTDGETGDTPGQGNGNGPPAEDS